MKPGYFLLIVLLLIILTLGCSSPEVSSSTAAPVSSTSSTTLPVSASEKDWTPDGIITPGEYSRSATYDSYLINWRSDDKYIYIGMSAGTAGWVAMAIQPGSRMKNADMILSFVRNGKTEIQDLFSTGDFGPHQLDTELGGTNDILAYGGKEEGTLTTIEFKRLLTTDDKYDFSITRGINKIIWAYGTNDNPDFKHGSRGYGELILP